MYTQYLDTLIVLEHLTGSNLLYIDNYEYSRPKKSLEIVENII